MTHFIFKVNTILIDFSNLDRNLEHQRIDLDRFWHHQHFWYQIIAIFPQTKKVKKRNFCLTRFFVCFFASETETWLFFCLSKIFYCFISHLSDCIFLTTAKHDFFWLRIDDVMLFCNWNYAIRSYDQKNQKVFFLQKKLKWL